MTFEKLIDYLVQQESDDIKDLKVISIGTMSGADKDCEYVVHLENGKYIKIG